MSRLNFSYKDTIFGAAQVGTSEIADLGQFFMLKMMVNLVCCKTKLLTYHVSLMLQPLYGGFTSNGIPK